MFVCGIYCFAAQNYIMEWYFTDTFLDVNYCPEWVQFFKKDYNLLKN